MNNDLFPSAAYRRSLNRSLDAALDKAIERTQSGPVVPTLDMEKFRKDLQTFDFQNPLLMDETVLWLIDQLERGLVHINSPRYFGLFNPSPNYPAQVAERITAAFNPQLATWTTSPVAVEIENHVIAAIAARMGLPDGARGHFTTGGSEANYTALLTALTRSCGAYALGGIRAFANQPVFYVSRDSHLAWIKIAHQAGLGRDFVRLVPTDGAAKMNTCDLFAMVKADVEIGHIPVMIVATAGTTNAGMIDPIAECAGIATLYNCWFHVDAAWGGAVLASDRLRDLLLIGGLPRADSITIDAHKWWATTMGCGIFITQHPAILSATFSASTSFMPSNIPDIDPYVTSVQWSRRFLGLRLFLSLATAGWAGYGEHVEGMLAMAELLKLELKRVGWRIVNDSPLGVVCCVPPDFRALLEPIVAHVLASGKAWISTTTFEGENVIRACVTSGLTTADDVSDLVTALVDAL
jgi:glutamate/tyrosine decarboxylase-like PLP-dependent enzyme